MATTMFNPDRMFPNWMVYWAGFRAPIHHLGRNGWNVAVSRNDYDLSVELILTLSVPDTDHGSGNIMVATGHVAIDYRVYKMEHDRPGVPVKLNIQFGSDLYVEDKPSGEPKYHNVKDGNIRLFRLVCTDHHTYHKAIHEDLLERDLNHISFSSIFEIEPFIYLKNPRDFYIRKASMQEVLDIMLEKQEPSQEAIRQRIINEQARSQLFAQINLLED